jgi:supervillin
MQTVIDYWTTKCGTDEKYRRNAFVITAGYEPVEFQTIFPEWNVHENVVEMNSQVSCENILPTFLQIFHPPYFPQNSTKEVVQLDDYFSKFQKSVYSIEVLKNRPLPEFVNPTKLELYLNDNDFEEILGMTKDSWNKLPAWKKNSLRKDHELF